MGGGADEGRRLRVAIVQHVSWEGPGALGDSLAARGAHVRTVALYAGAALPAPGEIDWLVSLGGPMGADDEAAYPFITAEKRAIAAALERGCTVLGICLGAQILGRVLGARVGPAPEREIGWHPVWRSADAERSPLAAALPARFDAFHWHGDAFECPRGAVRLLASAACPEQGFAIGDRVIGLQCHLETTPEAARALVRECPDDLAPGPFVQDPVEMLRVPERFARIHQVLGALLDRLPGAPPPPRNP